MLNNNRNSGHYPSSYLLFKTQLNCLGLPVPHRKYNTSPLRAQQVHATYRLVTIVWIILNIIHCPVFYLKHNFSETWQSGYLHQIGPR
jgi:hypothetical protein